MATRVLKLAVAVLVVAMIIAMAMPIKGIEDGVGDQNLEGTAAISPFVLAQARAGGKNLKCDKNPLICRKEHGAAGPHCCKKRCVNVFTDRNNCGLCSKKCKFGHGCCKGVCSNLAYDKRNCGKCGNKCKKGLSCRYGLCAYA